jgi:hypothetical protein
MYGMGGGGENLGSLGLPAHLTGVITHTLTSSTHTNTHSFPGTATKVRRWRKEVAVREEEVGWAGPGPAQYMTMVALHSYIW